MRIGTGEQEYEWIDHWAKTPETEAFRTGFAHGDMVVTDAGEVITFHQGEPKLLLFDKDGNLQGAWDTPLTNAHGMDLVVEDGKQYVWCADDESGQVVKCDLEGRVVMEVLRPDLPNYADDEYSPTSVAVNQVGRGGNGDVWVADGYGAHIVHRYDMAGNYIGTINGEEGAGRFANPHGLLIDTRKPEPELYIADRHNSQVQVCDLDGKFKRAFGSEFMVAPGGFTTHGELTIIGEHSTSRLTVVDGDDGFVCYLGENQGVSDTENWPNVPGELVLRGKFNSPHGQAADRDGNLYVTEWLIGGRYTKLAKT